MKKSVPHGHRQPTISFMPVSHWLRESIQEMVTHDTNQSAPRTWKRSSAFELTLFTFCPPGPEEREKWNSSFSTGMDTGRRSSHPLRSANRRTPDANIKASFIWRRCLACTSANWTDLGNVNESRPGTELNWTELNWTDSEVAKYSECYLQYVFVFPSSYHPAAMACCTKQRTNKKRGLGRSEHQQEEEAAAVNVTCGMGWK